MPAWPIVVQGAPELINGEAVVPGGREYFEQLRNELQARRDSMSAAVPAVTVEASAVENVRVARGAPGDQAEGRRAAHGGPSGPRLGAHLAQDHRSPSLDASRVGRPEDLVLLELEAHRQPVGDDPLRQRAWASSAPNTVENSSAKGRSARRWLAHHLHAPVVVLAASR